MMQYESSLVRESPNAFDDLVVGFFKSKFQHEIDEIFKFLDMAIPTDLWQEYKSRLERQLMPVLFFGETLDESNKILLIQYCEFFVVSALPILLFDKWLDTDTDKVDIPKREIANAFYLLWESQKRRKVLPGNKFIEIDKHLNENYFIEVITMRNELVSRYQIPHIDEIEQRFEYYSGEIVEDFSTFNRSVGRLYSNIVGGLGYLFDIHFSSDVWEYLRLFDVLRQIIDEIADVEDDVKQGNITLPILVYLTDHPLIGKQKILNTWKYNEEPKWLHKELEEMGIFMNVFHAGLSIYQKSYILKERLKNNYPFIDSLFVLYDMRLALMYRVKSDGWKDYKKDY